MLVHSELTDGEQGFRWPKQVIVGAPDIEDGGVRIRAPQKRDHGQFERRHLPDIQLCAALIGDPFGNVQTGVQRRLRVDLDYHFQSRLHDLRRNLGVGRLCQGTFVDLGRDGGGLSRDLNDVRLGFPEVETGSHRRDLCVRAVRRRHKNPEQRRLPRDQRHRKRPRLNCLGKIRHDRLPLAYVDPPPGQPANQWVNLSSEGAHKPVPLATKASSAPRSVRLAGKTSARSVLCARLSSLSLDSCPSSDGTPPDS